MGGLVAYGGDPKVVASRQEIERIQSHVSAVANELVSGAWHLLPNPIQRTQVNLLLPQLEYQLAKTRVALSAASESYFTTDAKIAHTLETVGHAIHHLPWLAHLVPKGTAWVAYGTSMFAPGDVAAQSTRTLVATTGIPNDVAHDRPVSYSKVDSKRHLPVSNLYDIGARLNELNNQSRQIRVETYSGKGGKETLLVYLPGTQTLNPLPGHNPFDPTTDAMLATDPKNSELLKAITKAVHEAGSNGKDVILAGYSLGGIAAANIAASGEFNVTGVITIGSPVGGVELQESIPVLSVEHSNDPVPAATGESNPLKANWVTTSRELQLKPGEFAMDAHELSHYKVTLALTDRSELPGVKRVRELILDQLAGKQLTETQTYVFGR